MIHTLSTFPPSFVKRVVILGMENGLLTDAALQMGARGFDVGLLPTMLTMPFAVHTSGLQDPSTEMNHSRPFAVMQTGRPVNPSRRALYIQLLRAGAVCRGPEAKSFSAESLCRDPTSSSCVAWKACTSERCGVLVDDQGLDCLLCAQPGAASCHEKLMTAPSEFWPSNSAGHYQLDVVAHTTFCLEARSDTAVRSHFYLSLQAGCIPVIFDVEMLKGAGIPWAWRDLKQAPELKTVFERTADGKRVWSTIDNFEQFSIVYDPKATVALETNQLPGAVEELAALANSKAFEQRKARVRRLQEGVGRAAPLFRYAERPKCEGDGPCDAFTMLAATLEAVALGLKII